MIPNVLSIAGSDPSGGAGIQADLKAISANGAYAMAVVTALTAQNTQGVRGVEVVRPAFVRDQIDAVFDDVRVDAVKIGMLADAAIAEVVADALERHAARNIVLDPVMVAKSGDRLLAEDAASVLRERLLPLVDLVTPNLPEAAVLVGGDAAVDRRSMRDAGRQVLSHGARAVLLKGGHLPGEASPDLLVVSERAAGDGPETVAERWFEGVRIPTANTHGTGCTLSSALAARLALLPPEQAGSTDGLVRAVAAAKAYIEGAIRAADRLDVGRGHGPTHHFFEWQ